MPLPFLITVTVIHYRRMNKTGGIQSAQEKELSENKKEGEGKDRNVNNHVMTIFNMSKNFHPKCTFPLLFWVWVLKFHDTDTATMHKRQSNSEDHYRRHCVNNLEHVRGFTITCDRHCQSY